MSKCFWMVFFLAATAHGADPANPQATANPQAMLEAQLAAGEFAPALALARDAATRQRHDAWLAQIAAAQAQAGARDAAIRTTGEIYDDRTRRDALAGMAAQPLGAAGGATQADFDSLIELITSTIKPTSWDTVGGPGSIAGFPTGVYVDSQGVLRKVMQDETDGNLAALRTAGAPKAGSEDVRRRSPLRMVSLPRLEKQVQLLRAAGQDPTDAMQMLAGLQRIRYVLVYPESGDLVLAGPAGDWHMAAEDRVLSTDTGLPVLRLDDLVVVLRHMLSSGDARFGCAITPTQQALHDAQAFLNETQKRPIRAEYRRAWLERLRATVGKQTIEVNGIDPRTRAARILVEADYRMKLVGMGLEPGVPGVQSYLASVHLTAGQKPPPMSVLRWWFTLNYDSVLASADRQAFALRGQGVQVLSENELLSAQGQQIHTGESDELNRQFARSFTAQFDALCLKYPVYAELRNLFDLALAGALMREEDLPGRAGWHMTCFGNPQAFPVQLGMAPQQVDTVVNYRVIGGVHILAGVSGGVRVAPGALVARQNLAIDQHGTLGTQRTAALPKQSLPADAWWWEGE